VTHKPMTCARSCIYKTTINKICTHQRNRLINACFSLSLILLFALSSLSAEGASNTDASVITSASFNDKALNTGISFVEIDGDLYARYKGKYGEYLQFSLKTQTRERFKAVSDYPVANFVRPGIKASLQNGFTLLLKQIDQRAHTPCPLIFNNYLALVDADGNTVSELAVLYKPAKLITGSLIDCPNSISESDHYTSKFIGLNDGIFVYTDPEREGIAKGIFALGGSRPNITDTIAEISVSTKNSSDEPAHLEVLDYCERKDIYKIPVVDLLTALSGEEIDYQQVFNQIAQHAEMEKHKRCQ
jgi:hypothetical protein